MSTSERDRQSGAGCLLALGVPLLLPMFLIGFSIAGDSLNELIAFFSAIRWNSWSAIWTSLLALFRPGTGPQIIPSLLFLLFIGYFAMMWQWIAHVCKWRLVLPPRRLWMMSSIYFITFALIVTYLTYPWLAQASDHSGSPLLEIALWIALCWFPPGVFLALTIPLWYYSPKVTAKIHDVPAT